MKEKNKVIFGVYRSRSETEGAVEALKNNGFYSSDISILFPSRKVSRGFSLLKTTHAKFGAKTGAGAGAVIGGTIGLLAGIGVFAIPGVGYTIAAGPLISTLAGASMGGAFGGMSGTLVGIGVPENDALRYEYQINNGGILLSVHTDKSDQILLAKACLIRTGAEDIAWTTTKNNEPGLLTEQNMSLNEYYQSHRTY